jgi:hypothetical protein
MPKLSLADSYSVFGFSPIPKMGWSGMRGGFVFFDRNKLPRIAIQAKQTRFNFRISRSRDHTATQTKQARDSDHP